MTSERVKVPFEGDTVDAEDVAFEISETAPTSFRLADGTTINMRHDVKKVYRLCDKKKEDGSPIYVLVGHTAIDIVSAPDQKDKKG
jgi:hypothetical protein